jgi:ATP-dependent DNA ligase
MHGPRLAIKKTSDLVKASGCKRNTSSVRGKRFFDEICSHELEGIVAKRRLGIYMAEDQESHVLTG